MNNTPQKILIVRNDKLGDFMLSWPALAALKQSLPNCEIHALVNRYTEEMAELCPYIDKPIIDPGPNASFSQLMAFSKRLRQEHYHAAITLFSTTRVAWMLAVAGIPYRLAPATKLAQIFYKQRLKQRRSLSEKPEYEYNNDLIKHYLTTQAEVSFQTGSTPYLKTTKTMRDTARGEFCKQHNLDAKQALVFIHPGSGGSANNLSTEQYAQIARTLAAEKTHTTVISAGPGEEAIAQQLADSISDIAHVVYQSNKGLTAFVHHIAFADLFISGSTGPLHIAGALNRPTAAFYPKRRSATALRWQTTNDAAIRLAFSPPANADDSDMSRIDAIQAGEKIRQYFLD